MRGDRPDKRRHNARQHDVRRIYGVLRCAIADDRSRDQCQARGVQTHEHDLRIARAVLLFVQFLQALHRFQPKRRGRAIQAEEIRCEIQRHVGDRWVASRHLGEDVDEDGAEQFGNAFRRAAVDEQLQDAAKEREVGNERQQQIEYRTFAGRQNAVRGLFSGVDLHHASIESVLLPADHDLVIRRALQTLLYF